MKTNRPWLGLTANNQDGNYTDLVSNSVILDDLDLLSESESLFQKLVTPQYFRPFIHEKTHHATFNSPVGLAISALYASCASMPFERLQQEDNRITLPIRDLIVLYFTYHLLEPLIEGLAVFAEHDAVPRNSSVLSDVAISATQVLFSEPDFVSKNLIINGEFIPPHIAYEVFLRANRLSEKWIEEKAFLLQQNINDKPFYLLGYLGVKGIYRSLYSRCPKLADPELFLLLMLDYWFSDEKLAEILLRFNGSQFTYEETGFNLSSISEYIQDRFDELYRNVESYAEECEIYFSTNRETRRILTQPSYRNATSRYSTNSLADNPTLAFLHGVRTAQLSTHAFEPKIFKFRREFRFSSQSAKVSIKEDKGTLIFGDNKQIELSVVPNADAGDYDVSIEGVQHGETGEVFVIISGRSGLVALKNVKTNEWNNPQTVEYFDDFPSSLVIKQSMERFAQSHFLDENSDVGKMLNIYIEQTQDAAKFLYPQLAFRVRKEASEKIITELSDNGFGAILSDIELKNIAQYSLLCGTGIWDVREFSRLESLDENLFLNEIDNLNTKVKEKIGVECFLIDRNIGKVMSYI